MELPRLGPSGLVLPALKTRTARVSSAVTMASSPAATRANSCQVVSREPSGVGKYEGDNWGEGRSSEVGCSVQEKSDV